MTTITNLGTLKTAIADYAHRDDLTTQLDGFVDRTSLKLGRDARLFENETSQALSVTAVENTLPSDFLSVVDIFLTVDGKNRSLRYYTSSQLLSLIHI